VEIVTDDGSEGRAGLVSGLVEERLGSDAPGQVFAVGPAAMLRKVIELALDAQIPCQVSLESRMACGVGACLGCVVRVRSTDEQPQYKRVCVDGPVFDAREVLL
jgi:dihydroorotate dehydrogenase electron transfer subunit